MFRVFQKSTRVTIVAQSSPDMINLPLSVLGVTDDGFRAMGQGPNHFPLVFQGVVTLKVEVLVCVRGLSVDSRLYGTILIDHGPRVQERKCSLRVVVFGVGVNFSLGGPLDVIIYAVEMVCELLGVGRL